MASLICCTNAELIGVVPSLKLNIEVQKLYLGLFKVFKMHSDVNIEGIHMTGASTNPKKLALKKI